jgi:hypothetical protein
MAHRMEREMGETRVRGGGLRGVYIEEEERFLAALGMTMLFCVSH